MLPVQNIMLYVPIALWETILNHSKRAYYLVYTINLVGKTVGWQVKTNYAWVKIYSNDTHELNHLKSC